MANTEYARTVLGGQTIVGSFADASGARAAIRMLEQRGFSPDRIGIIHDDPREAREPAGSYSPQGAIVGAVLGAILVAAFVIAGPEWIRSPVAIALGGFALIVGLAGIGWLAGRARVCKAEAYDELEDDVEAGATLVSVVADTADGVDVARATLERGGATDVRISDTAESV